MLNDEEQRICDEAVEFVRVNKSNLVNRLASLDKIKTDVNPVSVFMAGSPGAGKTEFSSRLMELISNSHPSVVCINPDTLREEMPGYVGGNAHIFQKAVSRLVDEIHSAVLRNKQSFLLDGTLSRYDKAEENIKRSIRRNREVYIYYVYQDPIQAWKFTQAREKDEGRRILKDVFIEQYFSAKETVNNLKKEFGKQINVTLVIKNSEHQIIDFKPNISSIDDYLRMRYSKDELSAKLNT